MSKVLSALASIAPASCQYKLGALAGKWEATAYKRSPAFWYGYLSSKLGF